MVNIAAIDLNLLVVLHAVLTERSVRAAAKRLGVTPSAVSNALARLRELLADPLFVRSGRGLSPTPRALEIEPELIAAVATLTRIVAGDEARDPAASTRTLVLACADGEQVGAVPAIAARLARVMPAARLRVIGIDQLEASGGLEGGGADAAFGPAFPFGSGDHHAPVYEDEAAFVFRRGHPLIGRRLTADAFNRTGHVDVHLALGRGGIGHRFAEAHLEAHGLARDVRVIVPSFAAAASVAARTDLIAGVPRRVALALAKTLPVEVKPPPCPPLVFPMALHWHERTRLDPVCALFREVIMDAVRGRARRSPSRPA
jgi:DNA-binding transcriptional LysR family regulator